MISVSPIVIPAASNVEDLRKSVVVAMNRLAEDISHVGQFSQTTAQRADHSVRQTITDASKKFLDHATQIAKSISFDYEGLTITVDASGQLKLADKNIKDVFQFSPDQFQFQTVGDVKFATIKALAADLIVTGTLGAGVAYVGDLNVAQVDGIDAWFDGKVYAGAVAVNQITGWDGATISIPYTSLTFSAGARGGNVVIGNATIDLTTPSYSGAIGASTCSFSASGKSIDLTISGTPHLSINGASAYISINGNNVATQAFVTTRVPDMTGQSGKFLTNNGSSGSWDTVPSGHTYTLSTSTAAVITGIAGSYVYQVDTDPDGHVTAVWETNVGDYVSTTSVIASATLNES